MAQTLFGEAKFVVHVLELPGFAIKLGEDADLGAQQLRNHGNGDVVDGATLVAANAIEIGEMHARDEDDRRALIARMLANQVGEFEAVDIGHADVEEDEQRSHS